MSNLNKLVIQLQNETQKITNAIATLEKQIAKKQDEIETISNGKVSREQFKQYLLSIFEKRAKSFKRQANDCIKNRVVSEMTFEKLEYNGAERLLNLPFLTGDFSPDDLSADALYYYFPEQLATRYIQLLPDECFDEHAPTKAERERKIKLLTDELVDLRGQRDELIRTLCENGITSH